MTKNVDIDKKNESDRKQNPVKFFFSKIKYVLFIFISFLLIFIFYDFGDIYNKFKTKESEPVTIIEKIIEKTDQKILSTIEDREFSQDIRIEELEEKYKNLELRLKTININNDLDKIIISFVELSSIIELEQDYDIKLEEFSILVAKDQFLSAQIHDLKQAIKSKNYKIIDISTNFNILIDDIVKLRNKNFSEKKHLFIDKIKDFLSNLVIVRRIDGKIYKDSDNIDLRIVNIGEMIRKKLYESAIYEIDQMPDIYQEKFINLKRMLNNQIHLSNINKSILLYLKKLAYSD